jgi:hypothetical protein
VTEGLKQLDVLIGDWVIASEKYSEVRGATTVRPAEDGKFLRLESTAEDDRFPHSTLLIGSDEARDDCTVLYYDARDVWRVYRTSVSGGVWKMWRDVPGFNQRFIGKISDDGKTIAGQWEMSSDGTNWEVDFDLTYTKVQD